MIAFCCVHVAAGAEVWQITRNEATAEVPESIDATCRICTGLPPDSFTADDVVVIHAEHLEDAVEKMLGHGT